VPTAITAVETSAGTIACDEVVVGVGPWINFHLEHARAPRQISVKGRDGKVHDGVRMWHYMALQEGTLGVDPGYQKTNDGRMPPVIHVDTDAPLHSDRDGRLLTDTLWGLYYKPDFHFGGVQGGAMPAVVKPDPDDVRVDPYGPKSPEFVVDDNFADMWTSALAFCQKRFAGQHAKYRNEPSGGIGCFTPDSFPVFDRFRENVYVIADSNHGYKMIGVGELVADELMGEARALLEPFRFSRYAAGRLHPVSNSPFRGAKERMELLAALVLFCTVTPFHAGTEQPHADDVGAQLRLSPRRPALAGRHARIHGDGGDRRGRAGRGVRGMAATLCSIEVCGPPICSISRGRSPCRFLRAGRASAGPPIGFLKAAAFQWVNPKAWVMAVGAVSTYAAVAPFPVNVIVIAALYCISGLPPARRGSGSVPCLQRVLRDPRAVRVFNVVMALLLVASLYPIVADGPRVARREEGPPLHAGRERQRFEAVALARAATPQGGNAVQPGDVDDLRMDLADRAGDDEIARGISAPLCCRRL
jgi:hypothetical protein